MFSYDFSYDRPTFEPITIRTELSERISSELQQIAFADVADGVVKVCHKLTAIRMLIKFAELTSADLTPEMAAPAPKTTPMRGPITNIPPSPFEGKVFGSAEPAQGSSDSEDARSKAQDGKTLKKPEPPPMGRQADCQPAQPVAPPLLFANRQ
jgi:hypothetical protein